MGRYRKKPIVIEATQWWQNGDHPEDGDERFHESGEFAFAAGVLATLLLPVVL